MKEMAVMAEKKRSMQNLHYIENQYDKPRIDHYMSGYAPVIPIDSAHGPRDFRGRMKDDPQFNLY